MKVSYLNTSLLFLFLVLVGNLIATSSAANNATKELCHPHDKRALLRILQQSNNTIVTFGSWDPATDCCNGWFTVRCDSNNRVNFLSLSGSGTETTHFPTALSDLPYLTDLTLENNVVGPIPRSLSKLRHLINLDLRFNRLSGPIPSFLGTFQNLSELRLANNLLTGAIPSSLGLLPSLSLIDFGNNKLTGPIPESFGSLKNEDLIGVDLSNNELSGAIPRSFKNAKFFFSLDFSGNKLEGDASFLFSKDKTAMAFIDISHNSFSFDMTNLTFTSRLASLLLNENKIFGSLPEALAELPDFNFFNVSYNQLCGHIPRGALKKFDKTSYLHNKCLCGTPLPHCK